MTPKYLLCPQCGAHRLFVLNEKGENVYFHVDHNFTPFPTKESNADLSSTDFSEIRCVGCSWKGRLKKLVKNI